MTRPGLVPFVARLTVALLLLMAPLGQDRWYGPVFAEAADAIFSVLGSQRSLDVSPTHAADAKLDTELTLINHQTGSRGRVAISSRAYGWMPTAFLAALIVASPIRWRSRLMTLGLGVAAISAIVALRTLIAAGANFSSAEHPDLLDLGPRFTAMLKQLDGALSVPIVYWYLIPSLVWLMLIGGTLWPNLHASDVANVKNR